jgi:hypothetical protein
LLADLKEWADMWEHHMGVETVCEACGTVWDGRLRGDDGHPYCADHVRMGG